MKLTRKIISLVLSLTMLLTSTGFSVFSYNAQNTTKCLDEVKTRDEIQENNVFSENSVNAELSEAEKSTCIINEESAKGFDNEASKSEKITENNETVALNNCESLPFMYFDNAVITDEMRNSKMFFIGSAGMELSEGDKNTYLMKVERGGALDDNASVTVKFADISTKYGENYELGIYENGAVTPIKPQNTTSVVQFFEENKETQEEIEAVSEEEVRQQVINDGGFSLANKNGEVVASALVEKDENGEVSGYNVVTSEGETAIEAGIGEGELQTNIEELESQISTDAAYREERQDILQEDLPGTEINIFFAVGENVKYIAITPIYSAEAEGDASAVILLKNPSLGYDVPATTNYSLLIKDEDAGEKAVVSLEKDKYIVEPNEDTIDIVITRENAKNELVYANIISYSDTADMGVDYQGIDAEVDFSPGMFKRTITLKVNHSNEDKEFNIKLLSPVGCELGLDLATVVIKKAENTDVALMGGYSASGNDNEFLRRLGDNLSIENFKTVNHAWKTNDSLMLSCKGQPYNEWEVIEYYFENPYIYDGVHFTWEDWFDHSWYPPYGSTSYIAARTLLDNGGQNTIFDISNTKSKNVVSAIFGEKKSNGFKFEILTSYRNGLQAKAYDFAPILREFEFELIDSNKLDFLNVNSEDAKKYLTTQFGCSDSTVRTVTRYLGQSITVSASAGQKEYARFDGLKFIDAAGHELCYVQNTTNSRSITVVLNEDFMKNLTMNHPGGYDGVPVIDYVDRGNGCFLGKGIKIQPIFKHIECNVTVNSGEYGYFNGDIKVTENQKVFKFNLGDRINLTTTVLPQYVDEYVGDGVMFEMRDDKNNIADKKSVGYYLYLNDDGMLFDLTTQNVVLTPRFSVINNSVVVKVLKTDLEKFKTDSGIFAIKSNFITSDEDYNYYTVSDTHVYLDQFIFMNAVPKDSGMVSVWKVPNIEKAYSGSVFYYKARKQKEDNVITLSVQNGKTIEIKGLVYDSAKKLSTGISSNKPAIPSQGALILTDSKSVMVSEDGSFELSNINTAEGTISRLLLYANSTNTFEDVEITESSNYDLGIITSSVNTLDTAHFENVYFTQDGRPVASTETLKMNGKKLTLTAVVSDGNKYKYEDETRTEKATEVTFYVLDGKTNSIKSKYIAKNTSGNIWTAEILKFNPENPDKYTYGDVIYVGLTTDRPSAAVNKISGNEEPLDKFKKTNYSLISTGFEIVQDTSYKPQTINLNINAGADAASNGKEKSFAEIPFIGALNFICGFTGPLKFIEGSETIDDDEEEESGFDPSQGSKSRIKFRIIAQFSKLPYGGTRFTIGLCASIGNASSRNSMGDNPVDSYFAFKDNATFKDISDSSVKVISFVNNKDPLNKLSLFGNTGLGNPMMVFSVSVGVYIDFGVIKEKEISTGSTSSTELVFIGAGGFISVGGSIEVQSSVIIPVIHIPGYFGAIGEASAAGFFGANKDAGNLIKYNTLFEESERIELNKLKFNVDVFARIGIKGYIGVGIADVLGARIFAGISLDYSFSPRLKDSFKAITTNYGLGLNFNVGGQIDLVFVSIPFDAFSIPIKNWGFTEYFREVGRAKQLCIYSAKSITNGRGKNLSEEIKKKIENAVLEVQNAIKYDETAREIGYKREQLLELSDKYNLLTKTERNFCTVLTSPFLSLTSVEENEQLTEPTRRKHVDSVWVGGEPEASLNGAFKESKTNTLLKNSISQPESKIISIGKALNGHEKMLSLFLTDVSNQGEDEETNIAYSIYDCTDKTWTEPKLLPKVGLYQYSLSILDIGDSIVITDIENLDLDYASKEPSLTEELQNFDVLSLTISKDDLREGREITQTFDKISEETAFYRNPVAVYVESENEVVAFYTKNTSKSDNIYDYLRSNPETTSVVYTIYDPKTNEIKQGEKKIPVLNEEEAIFNFCAESDRLGNILFTYTGTKDNENFNLYAGKLNLNDGKVTLLNLPIISNSMAKPRLYFYNKSREDIIEKEEDKTQTIPGDVCLTWMQDQGDLLLFNLSYFFNHDVDENGNIRGRLIGTVEDDVEIIFQKDTVDNSLAITDDYNIIGDGKGNIYVIWSNTVDITEEGEEFDITTPSARELYAIAYTGAESNQNSKSDDLVWSKPYRLTYSKHCNDGFNSAISSDGTMYVIHNQYDMIYLGESQSYIDENSVNDEGYMSGNPYKVSATNLCLTELDPIGTVEAKEIKLSNVAPKQGDEVIVDITFENTGLTAANGYTASVDLYKDGKFVYNIDTIDTDEILRANVSANKQVTWKNTSSSVEGMQIYVSVKEKNYDTVYTNKSEVLEDKAIITLGSLGVYQDDLWDTEDGTKIEENENDENFTLAYYIVNDGNIDLTNAKIKVSINPQYEDNKNYYLGKNKVLAEAPVEVVKASEYNTGAVSFSLPIEIFDVCGYESIDYVIVDENDNEISDIMTDFVIIQTPYDFNINGGEAISLKVGDSKFIEVDNSSAFLQNRDDIIYWSENPDIAEVNNDIITAKKEGTTKVYAFSTVYGTKDSVDVFVKARKNNNGVGGSVTSTVNSNNNLSQNTKTNIKFVDVSENDWYYDVVNDLVESGLMNGVSEQSFEPETETTRAMFVTMLYRLEGEPAFMNDNIFSDVKEDSYYEKAVVWANGKDIIKGVSETEFAPNESVTREQIATILYRYAIYKGIDVNKATSDINTLSYNDVFEISDWASSAVHFCLATEIINGDGDGNILPCNKAKRVEAGAMLIRFKNKFNK